MTTGRRAGWCSNAAGVATALVALAASSLGSAAPAQAAAPRGALRAITGRTGCLGPGRGCARLRGARGLDSIAISADGRTVYLAGEEGVAVLARDRRSGRLRQLAGRAGCVRSDRRDGCAVVRALRSPLGILVSPDDRSVYVSAGHGIVGFARSRRTGSLSPIAGPNGCLGLARYGCGPLHGVTDPARLLAAGNGSLYAAGQAPSGAASTGALATLSRDPASGRLTQLAGAGGCLNDGGVQGCASAPCLYSLTALALAPDGQHVYSGSTDSLNFELTSPGAVATFGRDASSGVLAFLGCVHSDDAVSDLAVQASGSVLVATLFGNRGTGIARTGIDLYVPGSGGALARVGQLACAADPGSRRCAVPFEGTELTLALAPGGQTLYTGTYFGGLGVLRVSGSGLAALPRPWGCVVSSSDYKPPRQCGRGAPESVGGAIAVSRDGRSLYAGTLGSPPGNSSSYSGGVAAFSIQR